MIVINEINKKLQIKLPISAFFSNPTPYALSFLIDTREKNIYSKNSGPKTHIGLFAASHNQSRSFLLNNLENYKFYNIVQINNLPNDIDLHRLEYAVKSVVDQHEIFKTILVEKEGKIYQKIDYNMVFKVEAIHLIKLNLRILLKYKGQ